MEKPELSQVGDENQTVLPKVAGDLRITGENIEVVIRGLELDHAALGVLKDLRLWGLSLASLLRKEAAVGHTSALIAELSREQNPRLQLLPSGVEQAVERRIKRCFCGRGPGGSNGTKIGKVFSDGVGGQHTPVIIAQNERSEWVRVLIPRIGGRLAPCLYAPSRSVVLL